MIKFGELVNYYFIKKSFSHIELEILGLESCKIRDLYDRGIKKTHLFFDLEWVNKECRELMEVRVNDIEAVVRAEFPLIAGSNLFSPSWYVGKTGRTTASCRCPLIDFIQKGAFLGLSPHPLLTGTDPVQSGEHDTFWQDPENYFRIQRDDSMLHRDSLDWLYGQSETLASALKSFTKYQERDFHDGRWWFNPEIVLGEICVELSDLEKFTRVLQNIVEKVRV